MGIWSELKVIDKDLASARLAIDLHADTMLILTDVEHVYREFATPRQKALERLTVAEARELLDAGYFGEGVWDLRYGQL